MSKRRGSRGVSARVARVVGDVASKMRDVRALWLAVHNDPKRSVADLSSEFYFAVGEIMEGRSLHDLPLRNIDRARVVAHAED